MYVLLVAAYAGIIAFRIHVGKAAELFGLRF